MSTFCETSWYFEDYENDSSSSCHSYQKSCTFVFPIKVLAGKSPRTIGREPHPRILKQLRIAVAHRSKAVQKSLWSHSVLSGIVLEDLSFGACSPVIIHAEFGCYGLSCASNNNAETNSKRPEKMWQAGSVEELFVPMTWSWSPLRILEWSPHVPKRIGVRSYIRRRR